MSLWFFNVYLDEAKKLKKKIGVGFPYGVNQLPMDETALGAYL